ncbi:DUF4124 domain-containing protein [Pseudoxanthomonas mexicana]|uniref:DUF4124 domain-containing protein n=1 Tax=Pseudoxanthomonas mexicana TaxID=128785 RepID=UPI003CE56F7E
MKWILGLLLAGLAASSGAQSVYKCRDAKGQPVYQSEPCPEAEKRWDTQPSTTTWDDYYKRQAADRKIAADRRHMRARAREISAGAGPVGTAVTTPNADACSRAKAARAQAYEAMGVNRDFEASRHWDNVVWNACK